MKLPVVLVLVWHCTAHQTYKIKEGERISDMLASKNVYSYPEFV
jgi:hypothetical protein